MRCGILMQASMSTLEADFNDTTFPLELVIDLLGSGGVPGLTPTVAVRLSPTTNSYLDWATNTFKTSGWIVKNQPMTDLGTGIYQQILNVFALGFTPLSPLPVKLIAEYTSTGTGTSGIDFDTIFVSELRPDAKVARQFNTNRLEALGGAPGTLTIYADDGVTVQTVQQLRDYAGGPVGNTPGEPAKRSAV
jgi:hypothetical protein